MTLKIERGRLNPADGGRGLGTAVRNWHENIPKYIEDQHDRIASAQRQRDAEIARPVPAQFPRTRELLELRRRHTELSTALQAAPAASDAVDRPDVAAADDTLDLRRPTTLTPSTAPTPQGHANAETGSTPSAPTAPMHRPPGATEPAPATSTGPQPWPSTSPTRPTCTRRVAPTSAS